MATYQGTITEAPQFDREQDAIVLRKAMSGIGTDDKAIIDVLTSRSNAQRQHIRAYYKTAFGRDLVEQFLSKMSGNYRKTVRALMDPPVEYYARCLYQATEGLGTDEKALVEILCTKNNQEIREIKVEYKKAYKRDLEDDIAGDTSGHFRRLMLSMCSAGRDESASVDEEKAKADAQAIFDAGEARWGTDESVFNRILATRSYSQLRATFDEYDKISKRGIEGAIISETSGDLLDGYLSLVKSVRDTQAFFAERLYKSMKGLGTDDEMLIRCIVSRAEIDLAKIKEIFLASYGQSLSDFIRDDTSGAYRELLLRIVNGNTA
ncbi:annexin-B12-like isoform X2 [Acanthaster planci]|uniref:Annexin n=1 Tax=Acanthaster planci TaxID=133434 RepID=A0A8B7YBG4_ACAPL|nr:annexin-B12-like isoform X2 [Acanthaster planci]